MNRLIKHIQNLVFHRFNLMEDKEDESRIIQSISKGIEFRGANLWALIFAIIIASIGLNTSSIPVIIGAMLISPLMGPIMGIGLGIGINDFELLKRGGKNLLIASLISIFASAIYFAITPLKEMTPELQARTHPALWDVFIAFFGGMAGIVAGTRKEKGNVIPGVAIATALMPPLCTVGYGIANGRWLDSLGALYLYFINSLMICSATFIIVKRLHFHNRQFATVQQQKRVSRYILTIVIVTVLPSIYLAYGIVEQSVFESNAKKFVQQEFRFEHTQVVSKEYHFQRKHSTIEVLLMGRILSAGVIDSLRHRLSLYHLDSARLLVHQGLDAKKEIDLAQIRASILEDVYSQERLRDTMRTSREQSSMPVPDVKEELKVLFPTLQRYSLSQQPIYHLDSMHMDTVIQFVGHFSKKLVNRDQHKLQQWLQQRLRTDSVVVVFD